jgi:hypothetical protein
VRADSSNLSYDTLTLSQDLEFDLIVDNSCVGFVYFVRLANDFLDFNALGNNYFSVKITFAEQIQFKGPLRSISADPLTESQIESLVIAKGYADCVAYISDEKISIAVASPEGGIQDKDVALIADIVMSQSDFDLEDIYVVEVQ